MLFAGKYELLDQLGEGAMGRVYRARHVLLDLELAVKVLHPQYSNDATFRARFLREARLPHAFVHKRSVTLRDFGVDDEGALYLTMDLCTGQPLAELIRSLGRMEPRRACGIALQVLEVLHEAHSAGILHRDIKPDNIMVDVLGGEDQIKVMDFGIAKIIEGELSDVDLTRGNAIGTPLYMSPEQCAGERLDVRSDLYSLGVVLYEMLAGSPPFRADTVQALLMKHLTQPVPRFRPEWGIPADLERLVLQALGKQAEERFRNARTFSESLTGYLAGRGGASQVEPTTELRPEPRAVGSRRAPAQGFKAISPLAEREDEHGDDMPDSVSMVRPYAETGFSGPDHPRADLLIPVSPMLERPDASGGMAAAVSAGPAALQRSPAEAGGVSFHEGTVHAAQKPPPSSQTPPTVAATRQSVAPSAYEQQRTQAVDLDHPEMQALLRASKELPPSERSEGAEPQAEAGRAMTSVVQLDAAGAAPADAREGQPGTYGVEPPVERGSARAASSLGGLDPSALRASNVELNAQVEFLTPVYVRLARLLARLAVAIVLVGGLALGLGALYLGNPERPIPETLVRIFQLYPTPMEALLALPGYARLEPLVHPTPIPEAPQDLPADNGKDPAAEPASAGGKQRPAKRTQAPATPSRPRVPPGEIKEIYLDRVDHEVHSSLHRVILRGPVPGGGDKALINGRQVYAHEGELIDVMTLHEGEQSLVISGEGPEGPMIRQLKVIVDSEKPQLYIESPENQRLVLRERTMLVGQVRDPYLRALRLNGAEVEKPKNGRFILPVELQVGENQFELEAEDLAGNLTQKRLTLLHRAGPGGGLEGRGGQR